MIDTQSNKVSMVGIYGIGGIGKTTIAKVIYNDMLDQFKRHSFLENVREKSKDDHGLLQLQEKLLCDILMQKNLMLKNVDEGIEKIKEKCCSEKVLLVLDDVDCPKQLKFLAPNSQWFHQGSIIIVTTRNKRCLNVHESYSSYEAKGLAHDQAMELFSWNAFQQHHPKDNYVNLSNRLLDYAKGLPLALVVLGSFLFQRDVDEWESTLHKLKTNPLEDIQKVLQISYDGLDYTCKELFLDIACFFKDEDEGFVTRILENCNLHAKIGLRVLDERCLISILDGMIKMHNLLQEMGWAIVRQNDPRDLGKWSRLWEYKDIENVLTENTGTKNIEGIFLKLTKAIPIQLTANAFKKMKRLRFFNVQCQSMEQQLSSDFEFPCHDLVYIDCDNYPWVLFPLSFHADYFHDFGLMCRYTEQQLSQDFKFPCHHLVYFHWDHYPLESLPSSFHVNNLDELNLKYRKIKHLCKGDMRANKLKVINLSHSKDLVDISSISSAPNLEILILKGCKRLESLPGNLHKLECLQTLSCNDCSNMKSFPEIKGNMGRLRVLELSETGIIEVPSSIRHLHGLETLALRYCKNLVSLSDSICSLNSLRNLLLNGCSELKGFPNINIGSLKALESLDLSGCRNLESLPMSDCNLSSLKTLLLNECSKLKCFPDNNIGSLKVLELLNLSGCKNLESLSVSICNLSSLKTLLLNGCSKLRGFPYINIGSLKSLESFDLSGCENLESLPESVCNLSSLKTLLLNGSSKLKSFPDINIGSLEALELLDLSCCKNLKSLPESVYNLSSLKTLRVKDCPKLEGILKVSLQVFSRPLGYLNTTCDILKSGVIWSNDCLSSLKTLNPRCDPMEDEILNHICPLSSLVELSIRNSHPEVGDLLSGSLDVLSLQISSLRNFDPMKGGLLCDIFHLSSLKTLDLSKCNLMEVEIPHDIWNLSSLVELSLSNCNLMEGEILNHVCHLSSLEGLSLDGNQFSSIPAGISRLSNLRALNLSHCKKLQQIPELPSSLQFLDAHYSDGISSSPSFPPIHSMVMVNNFESEFSSEHYNYVGSFFTGPGMSIVVPRSSGILEWIRYQSLGSDEVAIELPLNWCENNDLLGFALCCVYVAFDDKFGFQYGDPCAHESQNESVHTSENESDNGAACELENRPLRFQCNLSIRGNNQSANLEHVLFASSLCVHDGVSDIVWVICYPKVAIREQYSSNQWTHFMASFRGGYRCRVEECRIRLIYAEDYELKHPTVAQGNSSHGSSTENSNSKAHNKRNPTEQSPIEESHHKRFRETQD